MWRDDRQVALGEVIVACKQAADQHREVAALTEDAELAGSLRALADRREAQGLSLEAHLRELGDLPREPDADREALDAILARLRAGLAPSRGRELLGEQLELERALAEQVHTALKVDLPGPARAALESLREDVAAAVARLERAFARMPSEGDHSA